MSLHVVVGPSCAGKSTHAWGSRADDEPVIDYDRLASALGSTTAHGAEGTIAEVAFAARSSARRAVLSSGVDAWVIHTSPTQKHVDEYVDAGAVFVLVDPGEDECVARAETDGRPDGTVDRIRAWYADPPQLPEGTTTITASTRGTPMSRSTTARATPARAHKQNRYWGQKDVPQSKTEFFNAVTTPAPSGDGTVATIRLYGPIDSWGGFWGISTKDVGGVLDALPETVTQIVLRLNSPGGEVFEGMAILNLLRAHRASVTAVVDGLAASAASVIAAGCDETVMSPGTQLMIHSPWGIEMGNARDMRKHAEILDGIESSLIEVYAAKAGEKDWAALLSEETWLNADEAIAFGLADRAAIVPDAGEAVTVSDDDLEVITLDDDEIEDAAARARVIRFPERAVARSHMLPSSTETGTPTGQETAMPDLKDTIRARLGLSDANVSDEVIIAALDETLAEQATDTPTAPEGTVLMDAATLADLQAAANEGRQALAQQATDRRTDIVDNAVKEGRIAPASRAKWLEQLEANESGTAALIASLTPNTIPVAEIGENAEPTADQSLYASAWGTDEKGA